MMKFRVYALMLAVCVVIAGAAYAEDIQAEYLIGRVDEGLYTNRALGMEAYFGSNWYILSREEILELTGAISSQAPSLEDIMKNNIPVFYVMTYDTKANINITIQNLGIAMAAQLADTNSKLHREMLEYCANLVKENYKKMGFKDVRYKHIKTKFLGASQPGIYINAQANGNTLHQRMIVCIRGDYGFSICATSVGDDITDSLLGMFTKMKN